MASVFPIVEGQGDVIAVPLLLRRIAVELIGGINLQCATPFRLPRTRLKNIGDLSRALQLGQNKLRQVPPPSFILILMDADVDCPKALLETLAGQHRDLIAASPTSMVFAAREFETWFLAADMNASDHRALRASTPPVANPEMIADAKGRFRDDFMLPGSSYSETVDQPKFASCMDLAKARRSPSFDKLVREVRRHLGPR